MRRHVEIAVNAHAVAAAFKAQHQTAVIALRDLHIGHADAGAEFQLVLRIVAMGKNHVLPIAASEHIGIGTHAAFKHIVAGIAVQHVVAVMTCQVIIAQPAI